MRADLESLSDHLYVDFSVSVKYNKSNPGTNKRWNYKKMDTELLINSLEFLASTDLSEEIIRSPEQIISWMVV